MLSHGCPLASDESSASTTLFSSFSSLRLVWFSALLLDECLQTLPEDSDKVFEQVTIAVQAFNDDLSAPFHVVDHDL